MPPLKAYSRAFALLYKAHINIARAWGREWPMPTNGSRYAYDRCVMSSSYCFLIFTNLLHKLFHLSARHFLQTLQHDGLLVFFELRDVCHLLAPNAEQISGSIAQQHNNHESSDTVRREARGQQRQRTGTGHKVLQARVTRTSLFAPADEAYPARPPGLRACQRAARRAPHRSGSRPPREGAKRATTTR